MRSRSRVALIVVGALVALFAVLGVANKSEDGRQAILKWKPAFALMADGASPYARAVDGAAPGEEAEGYPTLPLSAVVMDALLTFGDTGGSVAFALLKLGCATWILIASATLARQAGFRFPPWAEWALFLLSLRVLLSDISHGNTNLLVGACVASAAIAWARANDARSGAWVAIGATLKITPALLALVPLRKAPRRAVIGLLGGAALGILVVPGLRYGFATNLGWIPSFADQMLAPYVEGRPPGPMQTEHINQSWLGMLARLFTDLPAIQARKGDWPEDVRLTLVTLSSEGFRWLHRAVAMVTLAPFLWLVWRRADRRFAGALFAVGSLVMLLISERSWKHHHVLVPLAIAWCLGMLASARDARERLVAGVALTAAALGQSLSGSGILGDRGSDLAEAWGAFLIADLALLGAVCWSLAVAPPDASDTDDQ